MTAKRSKARSAYHHGDLPRVLVQTAMGLLDEKGVEGFSLREVARRADVAAAAPSHHFENVTGLLTAVAAAGFQNLAKKSEKVAAKDIDPMHRLELLCKAYVANFKEHPGVTSIMFRCELLNMEDESLKSLKPKTLYLLEETVRLALPPTTAETKVKLVSKTLWATMHGLVTLDIESEDSPGAIARFAIHSVITGSLSVEGD